MTKLTYAQQVKADRKAAALDRPQDDFRQDAGYKAVYKNHVAPAATTTKTPQEKKEAVIWELNSLKALAIHCNLEKGQQTVQEIWHKRVTSFMLNGVNGKIPTLDQPELARRHNTLGVAFQQVQEQFSCLGSEVEGFDSTAFAKTVREVMGEERFSTARQGWYESYKPVVIPTKDVEFVAREIDELILSIAPQAWPSVA